MKQRILTLAVLLAAFFGLTMAAPFAVDVNQSYTSGTTGWGVDKFATIQSAITAVPANTIINVAAGTYIEKLTITKPVGIIGASMAGCIIDTRTLTGSSILTMSHSVTLQNLTVKSNTSSAGGAALKIQGVTANTAPAAQDGVYATGIIIDNVTVTSAFFGCIDLNGIDGAVITNCTVSGVGTSGNGIGITDSKNVSVFGCNVNTTSALSGIRMTADGTNFKGGIDHITIGAGNTLKGIYCEAYSEVMNTAYAVTNLDFTGSPILYRVKTLSNRNYIAYVADRAKAISNIVLNGNDGAVADAGANIYYVRDGLKLSPAIELCESGSLINVAAGTYNEDIAITKDVAFSPVATSLVSGRIVPGLVINGTLTIDNTHGFTTSSPIKVLGNLIFVNGYLYSDEDTFVELGEAASVVGESATMGIDGCAQTWRTLNGSPSSIVSNTMGNLGCELTNLKVNIGVARLRRLSGAVGNPGKSINRIWLVDGASALPNADCALTFSWLPAEDNGIPFGVLAPKGRVYGSLTGDPWTTDWTALGTEKDVITSGRFITITDIQGGYYTVCNTDAPVPVELASFSASSTGKKVQLAWSTATEKNNYGFEVERRIAGAQAAGQWQKLAFVEGAGTSNVSHSYGYTDAVTAGKYEYRLKQVDRDGSYEYSKTIEATVAFTAEDYAVAQNYPNPFNPTTTIRFAVRTAQHAVVKIYNSIGQEVRTLFNATAQPETMYSVTFDATGLPSGSYYYMLRTADRNEVKRMMLVK